jgi:hypothetical protein
LIKPGSRTNEVIAVALLARKTCWNTVVSTTIPTVLVLDEEEEEAMQQQLVESIMLGRWLGFGGEDRALGGMCWG